MIVGGTYKVIVQAPDILGGDETRRPWLVRAFFIGDDEEPVATSEHHDLSTACDETFAAVRKDIAARMDRGVGFGTNEADHRGAGADDYYDLEPGGGLSRRMEDRWFRRVDELLVARPEVLAHSRRNEAGEFAFSPASCPLCEAIVQIESQARADVLAVPEEATA